MEQTTWRFVTLFFVQFKYFKELVGRNPPLHLHSRKINFDHPLESKEIEILAPLPYHFKNTLSHFGIHIKH
jgi:hypothetical protein